MSPSKSDVTNRLLTEKPKVGTQPKSLFNFNRGNLFRVTPSQMMTDLELVLSKMNIQQEKSSLDLFSILCTCEYRHWILYADTEVILPKEAINFTVMVYEARWAGGRLGVKLKEADDDTGGLKDVYGSLYHSILNELGKLSHLNIV